MKNGALLACAALAVLTLATASAHADGDIRDNSFLVEEAYNQEPGVIQHINVLTLSLEEGGGLEYRFTEEVPLWSQTHQLSLELPVVKPGQGLAAGIGDVQLNYRVQAIGGDERTEIAFAPRVSLIFPTGAPDKGHGTGGFGLQANLPVSLTLASWLAGHTNLGITMVPVPDRMPADLEPEDGEEMDVSVRAAQSFIWLPHTHVNLFVEGVWEGTRLAEDPQYAFVVSPGLRGKLDFVNGLQLVGGFAFPIGVGPTNRGELALILYLSFEHPVPILR